MTQTQNPQTQNSQTQPQADFSQALAGQVALVTGGGSGLGAAICRVLAESGAHVIAADIQLPQAERLAGELTDAGLKAKAISLDVRDENALEQVVQQLEEEYGHLDILINNAGTDVTVAIEELSVADIDRVLDVNLRGPFLLSRAALPNMAKRGHGAIVNITSTAAKRAWANATAYHASKWGLLGFSHALHVEARPHGVRVTALVVGGMQTPFILERFPDTPLENLQDPRNVAEAVRYVLLQPEGTVVPEMTVIPMRETSWP
ncbi:SDR family oxidoreductase (plasmid) [Deinococcus metallilatus]|uniref:NAD(P)-dependent dehydrogenase (Short-subunit alcohol dehydrogenase family) n=1 Tax=Deinococcus metallilatus TaxID=1211322 RepID=A0AAJ5F5K7_9DEIO|nr:SDR family oxidoreductase [Deinococcus metallilatus]MBB5293265.1 NAD(P)-dependent dehydrogenase (short-subunit alcohol dehydrogenase family) [Deinococcus metallilatus]QBY07047.1 SDR family oxidoreductase [Deinococcus metallilatus]RXJ18058.1 SDR family oxidoreductase [Deinococcus metallilatus]TLK31994.1 SDR family oxidoreductase [Deinococcus metallilatus]GMA15512.1 short-chain dehydrogenase [Deinococcus metallilatus]